MRLGRLADGGSGPEVLVGLPPNVGGVRSNGSVEADEGVLIGRRVLFLESEGRSSSE